jgi:hypothetical protein
MYQKNYLLFLIFISFISLSKGKNFFSNEFKYFQPNKTIEYSLKESKLTMNFEGIHQFESEEPDSEFTVNYTANFYNQENDGAFLYSYSLVKIGNQTKGKVNWEVDIQKNEQKNQTVEIKAEASFNDIKENFGYDTFIIKYTEKEEEKSDKTFEFWMIYFGFLGSIILTFGVMYVYFYATMEIGRNTLMLNNLSAGLDEGSSAQEKDSNEENPRTTA